MIRFPVPGIVLQPFSRSYLIHNQYGTTRTRPEDPHVLEFGLGPGTVVAVDNDDSRHSSRRGNRQIEIGSHPQPRPAPVNQILPAIALALKFFGNPSLKRDTRRKASQGSCQRFQSRITKPFPIRPGSDLLPVVLLGFQDFSYAATNIAFQHSGKIHLRALFVGENP